MRKILTAGTVTLALLAAGMTLPASATTAPSAQEIAKAPAKKSTKKSKKPVVIKVQGHTARIVVRSPHGIRRATLNGTRLTNDEFRLRADGSHRVLRASSSHGLRHGRNVLRVSTNKRYKGVTTTTARFTVKGKRLLTGAGRDKRIAAGSGVTLTGTTRRHPSQKGKSATTRWRIVSAPAGSTPVLRRAGGKKPRLVTDLPGRYVVKATSGLRSATASTAATTTSDTVTVKAPASPMMPFNAWSQDGTGVLGISVAGQFYPDSLPLQDSAWQMLILDRTTLGVDEGNNRTYGRCGDGWCVGRDGGGPSQQVDMAEELDDLGPSELIVLVHRSQYGQSATPNPFTRALNIPDAAQPVGDESAAIVAVPGKNGGVHTYMHDTAGKADLSGYMMQDRYFNYTFVDDARIPFDTRSSQNCDATSCTATVTVGDTKRSYTALSGEAGLVVTRLDRRTLAFRDGRVLLTSGGNGDEIRNNLVGVIKYFKTLPDDDLVIITSIGAPGKALMGKPSPVYGGQTDTVRFILSDPATQLGAQIARLGGTRHRFLQSSQRPNDGYTLVGYPGLEEGQGNEVHAKSARLTGAFQRDASQMFVARAITQAPERFDTLTTQVMNTPNTIAWPGEGNPAYKAVLTCLAADKAKLNQADPRLSYWSNSTQIKAQDWDTWFTDVKRAQHSDCPDTDPAVFDEAKKQFQKELLFNYYLRSYIDDLKSPYSADAAIADLANLNKWSSELKADSDEIKSKGIQVDWFALIATAIEAVAPFLAPYLGSKVSKAAEKLVEKLTHALSAATAGALELGGGSLETGEAGEKYLEDDKFNAEVGKLGSEVVDRLQSTADNFDRMGDVIASDYAKLSAIGSELLKCQKEQDAGRTPGEKGFDCDPSFFTNNITLKKAEATASHTAEQTIYEKVLPLTFPVTRLPWDGKITMGFGEPEGNWDATLFDCFNATPFPKSWPEESKPFLRRSVGLSLDRRFRYSLDEGADPRLIFMGLPQFDAYVIAAFGKDRFNVETADKTVERLFGATADSTDPADGGLGADPVDFVLSQKADGKVKDYPLGCGGFEDENTVPAPFDR
ncbi:MAG: hypothetical protein KDC08_02165 [Actinobacteria bacterium]|mgnify:CR=1 FL=1|nr:hypothetical protein [Actinomycetota bacterium]